MERETTFPCAHCGSPVPLEKAKQGVRHIFCKASCERACCKGMTEHDRISLFSLYRRKVVVALTLVTRRSFRYMGKYLSRTDVPQNAPKQWHQFFNEFDRTIALQLAIGTAEFLGISLEEYKSRITGEPVSVV